jgi:hypothetical protein
MNATPAIRPRGRPLRTVPRPDTGLIMATAPELSTIFARYSRGIRTDPPQLRRLRLVQPSSARRSGGPPATRDCACRSRVCVKYSDVRVLVERAGLDQRRRRPRRGAGTSVGRCRSRRIRSITEASSIRARWRTPVAPVVLLRGLMAGPHENNVMAGASQGLSAISRKRPPQRAWPSRGSACLRVLSARPGTARLGCPRGRFTRRRGPAESPRVTGPSSPSP